MWQPVVRVISLTTCVALALLAACSDDGGSGEGVAGTGAVAGHTSTAASNAGGAGTPSGGNPSTGGRAGSGGAEEPGVGGAGGDSEVAAGASQGGGAGLGGEGGHPSDAGAAGAGGSDAAGASGAGNAPEAPEELRKFAAALAAAVAKAQKEGRKNCGRAIPAVPVDSVEDAWVKVREFVAQVTGVKPAALKESATKCNLPATAACANLFQNDVYHSDGRLGDALYPFAQQVDADTETNRVVIFTPQEGNVSQPPVVVTAGVYDGFLMGVAFFDGRAICSG